jgi:hypothetical protein
MDSAPFQLSRLSAEVGVLWSSSVIRARRHVFETVDSFSFELVSVVSNFLSPCLEATSRCGSRLGVIRERWAMLVCALGSDTRVRSKATSHTRGGVNIVEDVGRRASASASSIWEKGARVYLIIDPRRI